MEDVRIGVYVCWCGTNIAKMVDVESVSEQLKDMPGVVVSKNYKYMCSDPGQELIIRDIKEHHLNRVVVSACSPRIHELTFRKALENAGLNPYMFEMANIREHVSWVHTDREKATRKAASLVRAAIRRVQWHESLDKRTVEIKESTLIIGGGISGISAALEIADAGKKVFLIEKQKQLGGLLSQVDLTYPYLGQVKQILRPRISRVMEHPHIEVFTETTLQEVFGYVGNFKTELQIRDKEKREVEFGNVIIATGLKPFEPSVIPEYGYGKHPDVLTSLEMERKLKENNLLTSDGKTPKHVVLIHCVGSRNADYHEYCSRVCCMTALKQAWQIKSALPQTDVYDVYADMRAFGKGCEEFYALEFKDQALFLMYDQKDGLPQVSAAGKGDDFNYLITFHEKLSGVEVEVPADMIVLMTALEAHDEAKSIAHAVGVSMCGNEFYIERHPKLDPVATTTDGVYLAGSCQAPKEIPEAVAQAKAAAARILATINRGFMQVEVTTAVTNEDLCCGCQTCIKVCPYGAIDFNDEKNVSEVNEVLCKGCGTCGSACPTGAIRSRHFTDEQIMAQIEGLMYQTIEK